MNNDEENFITSEIPISGQLGMTDKQAPKAPGLPKTSGGQPHYTVQQQSQPAPSGLLPTTGEFQQVGGIMLGLLCLILVLMFISKPKTKISV